MKFFKKITYAVLPALTLFSCVNSTKAEMNNSKEEEGQNRKVLVAYFSVTGTTKKVAESIAELSKGTLFEIEPVQPYSTADLDWRDKDSRSSVEMAEKETSRPEIKNKVDDFSSYDIIFVGFPVWWYTCPTIINTFLESYDFKGKTIIPFATSGGSPIEPCVKDMEKSAPEAIIKDARLWNNPSNAKLQEWIEAAEK